MKCFLDNIDKKDPVIIALFITLSSCIAKSPIKSSETCCNNGLTIIKKSLPSYNPILGNRNIEIGNYKSSPVPLTISVDNNGKSLIIWNDGGKKLENLNPVGEQFSLGNDFGKSEVSIDSDGNGILVWTSNSIIGTFSDINIKLYGILLKNYLPYGQQFLISDNNIDNNPEKNTFKSTINKDGNGFIIWQTTTKEIYGYNINNFKLDNDKVLTFSTENIDNLYILSSGSDLGIKVLSNTSANLSSNVSTNLDISGNGYITSINENKSLEVRLVHNYIANNSSNIISKSITGSYKIELDSFGNGLLIWQEYYSSPKLYIEVINNYSSVKKTSNFSDNQEPIFYPNVKINAKKYGLIAWYTSNHIYIKKILPY
ncbi:MAG: hypothetical protein H7263_09095 [Candidatus Sericytochromatia bacterium]|nr:hypothetical protein [Candidatus Sericytochromatia bacterium]